MNKDALNTEWCLLQTQYDSYEKHSLYIKLITVVLFSTAYLLNMFSFFFALIIAVLWLQDAIWKTFQSRIEPRLLTLESAIAHEDADERAFQFNSQYQANSRTGAALINEYLQQAIKPTIAFPYAALLLMVFVR